MRETVIKDLSFSYPGTDKLVLKDINMDVAEGEFVSILGQSGCGKSTLLRLLAGLEKQTSGEILIDGKCPSQVPASAAAWYSRLRPVSLDDCRRKHNAGP